METAHSHRQVQQNCSSCGACMGKYFCKVCKFFDDDVSVLESQTMNKETELDALFTAFLFSPFFFTYILYCSWSRSQRASTTVTDVEYVGKHHHADGYL
jgi:hypothetical protein